VYKDTRAKISAYEDKQVVSKRLIITEMEFLSGSLFRVVKIYEGELPFSACGIDRQNSFTGIEFPSLYKKYLSGQSPSPYNLRN